MSDFIYCILFYFIMKLTSQGMERRMERHIETQLRSEEERRRRIGKEEEEEERREERRRRCCRRLGKL